MTFWEIGGTYVDLIWLETCYVKPRTVKYYLKRGRQKVDYQIQSDGSVIKYSFGGSCQLVFHFVRGDGTATEWDHVLQSCQ